MKTQATLIAILGLAAAAGCANSLDALHPRLFDQSADTDARVNATDEAMAAASVREDATLEPVDFDGAALSATGLKKLNVLMPATTEDDVTVYVDVPSNKLADARKDTVAKYYADAGVTSAHIDVQFGANPNQHTPAAVGLRGLEKQDAASPEADTSGSRGAGTGTSPDAK